MRGAELVTVVVAGVVEVVAAAEAADRSIRTTTRQATKAGNDAQRLYVSYRAGYAKQLFRIYTTLSSLKIRRTRYFILHSLHPSYAALHPRISSLSHILSQSHHLRQAPRLI